MRTADHHRHIMPRRATWALAFASILCAACTQTGDLSGAELAHERLELANMRESNKIPKSSPATFEKAFVSFCLNGGDTGAAIAAKLRQSDYVAAGAPRNGQSVFVVDDTRPMVVVSHKNNFCAVRANSRAGQTARSLRFIANRFPNATAIAPPRDNYLAFVQTTDQPTTQVALLREYAHDGSTYLTLAIYRRTTDLRSAAK